MNEAITSDTSGRRITVRLPPTHARLLDRLLGRSRWFAPTVTDVVLQALSTLADETKPKRAPTKGTHKKPHPWRTKRTVPKRRAK